MSIRLSVCVAVSVAKHVCPVSIKLETEFILHKKLYRRCEFSDSHETKGASVYCCLYLPHILHDFVEIRYQRLAP